MDSGACTQEERDAIREALDMALGILAGGAAELESEYPDGFQGFSSFGFVKVSDAGSAQIIVTDADLGVIGGRAALTSLGGRIVPPSRVEISCDAASAGADILISIILHELGHALGLGHASFSEYNGVRELMYEVLTSPMTYPSTLDFYAIYQLFIRGYEGGSVSLPDWLPYAQVTRQGLMMPQEEGEGWEGGGGAAEEATTLQELERKYEDLRRKYDSLSDTVINLGNDVQRIEERLDELERRVEGLEERVDALGNETAILGERVNAAEGVLSNHTQQIARLNESLSRLDGLERMLSLLEDSVGRLNTSFEEFVERMNYTQHEWLRKLSSLAERQGSLGKEVEAQGRWFDEKVSSISQRLDDTRSDVEKLKLKVVELEKELEARNQEIMRLRRCGLILSILFLASIMLAAVGLSRASKAMKVMGASRAEDRRAEG